MEFIVEKIGMSRTVGIESVPVTLLKIVDTKVVDVDGDNALVAYVGKTKSLNKATQGQQKKYGLSKEFNKFASLSLENAKAGDLDLSALAGGLVLKASFKSKGRGYSGVVKRHGFGGGPKSHGSRFHKRVGSIGNREFPGRVQKGKKMAGQYGNKMVTSKVSVYNFDAENKILAVKGSVAGANGSLGRLRA
ncbi:MAG: 50S ribosomal protein L3 [Helicobacteraceae bacterium]